MTNADTGLPGSPSTTASPSVPGEHRLARPDRDPPEIDRAARRLQRGPDEVVIADRRAAGGDDDVGLRPDERGGQRVEPVGDDAEQRHVDRQDRRASRRASRYCPRAARADRPTSVPGAISSSPVARIATRSRRLTASSPCPPVAASAIRAGVSRSPAAISVSPVAEIEPLAPHAHAAAAAVLRRRAPAYRHRARPLPAPARCRHPPASPRR